MPQRRETFSKEELANCLRYYDLGHVHKVQPFRGGSRQSPKVIIFADRGRFLLKRRAKGKDDLAKVAFAHQIQATLTKQNFPLPHLIGTREDNNSVLVLSPSTYEMFEFIEGVPYGASPEATYYSGRTLGLYHKLLQNFTSDYRPPKGSYHNADTIRHTIRTTVTSLPLTNRPPAATITNVIASLENIYDGCGQRAVELGLDNWPKQITHGDWHPGNMLFRDARVVSVIDHDSARLQQRVMDIANGALQFSIIGGRGDPTKWPKHVDVPRFKKFIQGYDSVNVISKREILTIPHLMCEAMIAETVLPIAATGRFGGIEGFPFLQMVNAKVSWICENRDDLCAVTAR